MTQSTPETQQCPNCGHPNPTDRALCAHCNTPLTAYAGQLIGETYQGRLASQVAHLNTRPLVVTAVAIFNALFAVFWPLAYVVGGFMARQAVNAEGTNYIGSALGSVGPILSAMVLIPLALALLGVAWGTWTQQTWAWTANLGTLGLFALLVLLKHSTLSLLWLAIAGGFAIAWFAASTQAWFGRS